MDGVTPTASPGPWRIQRDYRAQSIVLAILRSPGVLAAQLDQLEFDRLVALVQQYRPEA